jgi:hypothetical protein
MSDATWFAVVFVGFFVLRIVAATVVSFWILPQGDRCPNCDAPTLRLEQRWITRLLRSLRPSWCLACGWRGMLREGPLSETPSTREVATRRR